MTTWAVLASGPSMSQELADFVRGKCKVAVVSDCYKLAGWADALISNDKAWWENNPQARKFSGRKFSGTNCIGTERISADGNFGGGSNSGLQGMRVAQLLGATRILLLGFDMHGSHYFGAHPHPLKNTTPQRFKAHIKQFSRWKGCEVVNCTPNSALKQFKFMDIKEALGDSTLIVSTPKELKFSVSSTWTDKDSKIPRFRELYEKREFLEAYAEHTNLRMRDDPKWAIGRGDEWESHGQLQLAFLIQQGMKPHHRLLDVGCGPGRAARKFVPYLDYDKYTGTDISTECISHATALSLSEGWADKRPVFVLSGDLELGDRKFDFCWAHSVFTHLPEDQIEKMIGSIANMLATDGKFLFTFKKWTQSERTGLKQFRHSLLTFDRIAKSYCMQFKELPKIWPASQRTGMITRSA